MGRSKIITDKNKIIEVAEELLDAEGIEAVSIRRLSKEMQVSSMTLYNYVSDVNDIFREILIRCFSSVYENTVSLMEVMISSGMDKDTAYMRSYALSMFDYAEQHPYRSLYMTSIGHKQFFNDAELRPFYKPFNILINSSEHHGGNAARDPYDPETAYRALYYFILSSVYEKTSGIRAVSRIDFLNETDAIITRLFKSL